MEEIKDFYGRIIGYIDHLPNGDQIIKNFYKQNLGTYVASLNVTRDFFGRNVSTGNTLTALLYDDIAKRK